MKGVKDVLILIYTGMRAGEYISLAAGDVNLRQQYINVKKSKTLAGIRKIPIHKKILPILAERKAGGKSSPVTTTNPSAASLTTP